MPDIELSHLKFLTGSHQTVFESLSLKNLGLSKKQTLDSN